MELLLPGRFEDSATAYGYVRTIFDQVAGGSRPATVSITPSTRHVGVTRRDTFRPGFRDAVRVAGEMGYPVLVRSSGGGATAADRGTFGFSIIRPADEKEPGRGIRERYDEAAALQTTERRQPTARRIRGGNTGRNRGLRRRSGAGLRRRPRQARREDAATGHCGQSARRLRRLVSTSASQLVCARKL